MPGLTAKPIIDIMVGLRALDEFTPRIAALEGLGYAYRPELESDIPGRRFFVRYLGAVRTHHLHVVEAGGAFWTDHVLFRDHLRNLPAAREAYNRVKLASAQQYRDDRDAYTRGKSAFILEVLAAARARPAV